MTQRETRFEAKAPHGPEPASSESGDIKRRGFLTTTTFVMGGGLAASYGTFFAMAGRFLFPATSQNITLQFLATVNQIGMGESITYFSPSGAEIVVARQGEGESAEDFIALSSVCPHLGCQVHWEPQNDRFFCPCHNGAFDRLGQPTEGPPAAAGQQLNRFPLTVEDGLIFIEAPVDSVTEKGNHVASKSSSTTGKQA